MSQSTAAIICYGIELGDEGEIPEWVWELAGVKDTREDQDDDGMAKYELDKALEKRKLTLVHHCSDSCTMFILAAAKSVLTANRGYPVSINHGKLSDDTGVYRYLLQEELRRVGKEIHDKKTKARWLLCSWWG